MFRNKLKVIVFGIAVLVGTASPASASDELRNSLKKLAEGILDVTGHKPVSIGQFSPTGLPYSNAGVGIEQVLRAELEVIEKGCVTAHAPYEVKGDYLLVHSPTDKERKEIKIKARLIKIETGDEVELSSKAMLETYVSGTNTLAEITQVTGYVPPDGTKDERNKALQKQIKNPTVFVGGPEYTLISSHQGSPFAVEILVKSAESSGPALPRPAHVEHGFAYVDIQRNEIYELKIHNKTGRPVAVNVSIDGLDAFHFCKERKADGRPKFSRFVALQEVLPIVGWFITPEKALSFLVTEYGKGAVSYAGVARGQVGVIHVQFSECSSLAYGAKPRGGNETGFGPPRKTSLKPVNYQFEPPHDFVTIRYNR
jgi:hypothetical protein